MTLAGGETRVAQVILDLKTHQARQTYSYIVPPRLVAEVELGTTVIVPVRGGEKLGHVTGFQQSEPDVALKEVVDLVRGARLIGPRQFALSRWMSGYYMIGPNDALNLMLPAGLKYRLMSFIHPKDEVDLEEEPLAWLRLNEAPVTQREFERLFGAQAVRRLLNKGLVDRTFVLKSPSVKPKLVEYVALSESSSAETAPGAKGRALLQDLKTKSPQPLRELVVRHNTTRPTVSRLLERGLVETFKVKEERGPDTTFIKATPKNIVLNDDQCVALKAIIEAMNSNDPGPILIEGVTGSGKTEVYIRAAAEALGQGKASIFLVPEIALLPQLAERLAQRFGDRIAVVHSALKDGEKADAWQAIAEGRKKIVVGPRSALFAPVDELGLIVMDEEHETSYKQGTFPRYDARVVAEKLAQLHGATLVLGSATPSLEARERAGRAGRCVKLTERASGLHFPEIEIVDMRREIGLGNYTIFSRPLLSGMRKALDDGHKAILLMNRRGFASFLLCEDCGHVPTCANCSISLTWHKKDDWLKCHHCGAAHKVPSECPECKESSWKHAGVGTQRVESELNELIDDVTVVRMDADTTARRGAHYDRLIKFHEAERAVLIGTQMVAKGLDFPEVAVVGIINADTALNLPDFRAAERTAQLLIQVSGRSGRGAVPGRVFVQTYNPQNYAIRAATEGYAAFCSTELAHREALGYPPFSSVINVVVSSPLQETAAAKADELASSLRGVLADSARILGPAEAPIGKIKQWWRRHLMITTTDPERVKTILRENGYLTQTRKNLRIIYDVDPIWLL